MYNVIYLYAMKVHSFSSQWARDENKKISSSETLIAKCSTLDMHVEKIFDSWNDVYVQACFYEKFICFDNFVFLFKKRRQRCKNNEDMKLEKDMTRSYNNDVN
jgi:hypothetical protein